MRLKIILCLEQEQEQKQKEAKETNRYNCVSLSSAIYKWGVEKKIDLCIYMYKTNNYLFESRPKITKPV